MKSIIFKVSILVFFVISLTGCANAIKTNYFKTFGGVKTDAVGIVLAPALVFYSIRECKKATDDEKENLCKIRPLWFSMILVSWGVVAPLALIDLPFSAIADLVDERRKLESRTSEVFWSKKEAERSARMNQEEKFKRDVKVQNDLKKNLDEIQ